MTDAQFMGLLIGAIVTLLGIASIITAIIVKPIINLNKSITKLDLTVSHLSENSVNLKSRVDKHGEQIDNLEITVAQHEVKLNNILK